MPFPDEPAAQDPGTSELLDRTRAGDARAADSLFRRVMPKLARWVSRRLPREVRPDIDTSDVVQDTLIRSLTPLERFESRGPGALDAYLRQVATNRIRDEIRRLGRRPRQEPLSEHSVLDSPLDAAIRADERARFERSLDRLRPLDRAAITLRLTDGLSYEKIAEALGKPTPQAARVAITRALMRLAREMNRETRS